MDGEDRSAGRWWIANDASGPRHAHCCATSVLEPDGKGIEVVYARQPIAFACGSPCTLLLGLSQSMRKVFS
jgi:hypothetical protein